MSNEQEIREAIQAADSALFHLRNAQQKLRSARNWGIYDLLGGGFFSTLIKHSKMDRARDEVEAARNAVCRFSRELSDVAGSAQFEMDTDDFLAFADYFFDGFLAESAVHASRSTAPSSAFPESGISFPASMGGNPAPACLMIDQ